MQEKRFPKGRRFFVALPVLLSGAITQSKNLIKQTKKKRFYHFAVRLSFWSGSDKPPEKRLDNSLQNRV